MGKLKTYAGAGLGAIALAASSATPAMARDSNGIGTVEVIAGAALLAGVVAILASDNDDDRYDNRYYGNNYRYNDGRYNNRGYNYNNRNAGRYAVEQCVYATERQAARYGGRPDVTQIRDVDRNRDRYRVKGRVQIEERGRWRRNDRAVADFNCTGERGRVVDVNISRFRS